MNLLSIRINENQAKWICRIFSAFILAQPILDLFTSLSKHAGSDFTIGILARSIFMVACVACILFLSNGKKMLGCKIYVVIVSAYCFLFLAWSFYQGGSLHAISNLKELIKSVYFLYVIVGVYWLYQTVGFTISTRVLAGTLSVYLLVIFLAFVTGTSFQSYTYASGYNGWYYAANEISSIIAVLSPIGVLFCLNLLGKREVHSSRRIQGVCIAASVILLLLISFCASFIGTKAVFAAVLLYLILLVVWSLIQWLWTKKRQMLVSALLTMLVILSTITLFFASPLKVNLKGYVEIYPVKSENSTENLAEIQTSGSPTIAQKNSEETDIAEIPLHNNGESLASNKVYHFLNWILSNRLEYIKPSIAAFIDGTWIDKLLGVGYLNLTGSAYNIEKAIEMDGLAILIRHGIFGSILYLIPLLYFFYKTLCFLFRYHTGFFSSINLCTYFYSIIIGLFLALATGHTLVAPAVSIFLAILIVKQIQEMKQYRDCDTEG